MKVVILASGSKGNCTYIETKEAKILLDAGISYTQVVARLASEGIAFTELDAILITHEHIDHAGYASDIARKMKAETYVQKDTYFKMSRRFGISGYPVNYIENKCKYQIKDLTFVPLTVSHDADNTFSYLLKNEEATMGWMTDLGFVPEEYLSLIAKMNLLVLESNHDVEMLLASNRPWELKQRILSNHGHISNETCRDTLKKIINDEIKYVVLAHISEECNDYDLAYGVSNDALKNTSTKLFVSKQYEPLKAFVFGEDHD